MSFVIEPPQQPSIAVLGTGRYPVRRIFCVGRNYADHVREMGNDPSKAAPVFFTKPGDAVVESGSAIAYAANTDNLHHEVELVAALGKGGAGVSVAEAPALVWGYAVGVDLTRRDRQNQAKQAGEPWDLAKAFDQSAPIGALTPRAQAGDKSKGRIWLSVNGQIKQSADLGDMIWSVPEIIAALSRSWTLAPGDLIFTGTPAGVGALSPGSRVACGIEGLSDLNFTIAPR
jgi:fumarylpyruvate hydrolase